MLRTLYALSALMLTASLLGCGGGDYKAQNAYYDSAGIAPHQGIGPEESGDKYDRKR